jgi:RND family efflux transporter MFP subunit
MSQPPKPTLEALRIERPERPANRARPRWPWIVVLLLLVAGGLGIAAWQRAKVSLVVTAPAVPASGGAARNTVLNASGYVTARRQATVSSKATGKVVEVMLEEGMRVEAGQVLARLDTSNVEASLRLAQAQALSARRAMGETEAQLDRAELELKRIRPLAAQQIASPSDLDRAEADVKSFRARLALQEQEQSVAEHQVNVWKLELEDRTIRAPFAGIVVSKNAQPGEMISPISAGGGFIRTGIGTLVDMTSLEIEVDVNEGYINRVTPGQKVTAKLDAYADWEIPAKVIAIIPTADRQKATVKVRIGFEHLDPRILPDMGVKVAFEGEDRSAASTPATGVLVPREAIRQADGRDVVWVVLDHKVERRAIQWDKHQTASGGTVTVSAGLTAGEEVVVRGPATLSEGDQVRTGKETK